jgi:hypothetical protein
MKWLFELAIILLCVLYAEYLVIGDNHLASSLFGRLAIGLVAGLVIGWVIVGLKRLVLWCTDRFSKKMPRTAFYLGTGLFWLGVAVGVFCVGTAGYIAFEGGPLPLAIRFVGIGAFYCVAGWCLQYALRPLENLPVQDATASRLLSGGGVSTHQPNNFRPSTKQRKIAISLAVVGAAAAPFVSGTFKMEPTDLVLEPLTAEQRADITAYLTKLNNCREFETMPIGSIPDVGMRCFDRQADLKNGGVYDERFATGKYVAWNVGAVVAAFAIVFGLAYVLPPLTYLFLALARRYWRWLNT